MTTSSASDNLQLFAAAFKALPHPVVLYDETQVLFANAAAQRLFGGSRSAQVEGTALEALHVPELSDVGVQRRMFVLHGNATFTDVPVKVRTLDGQTLRLRVDMRPVSLDGTTIGMLTLPR